MKKLLVFLQGARSFYVIDTDKKHLIEVEANSKDELEKFVSFSFSSFDQSREHFAFSSRSDGSIGSKRLENRSIRRKKKRTKKIEIFQVRKWPSRVSIGRRTKSQRRIP